MVYLIPRERFDHSPFLFDGDRCVHGLLYTLVAITVLITFVLTVIGGHWQIETEKTFL